MSRQCRICLDTNDSNEMISPCLCRGTAKFIHKTCLEEYLRHFPDGVCTVCKANMTPINIFQWLFYMWFLFLIYVSIVPLQTKAIYIAITTLMFLYMPMRNMAQYWMLAISLPFVLVDNAYTIQLTLLIGVITIFVTIHQYIPIEHLLILISICLISAYVTILALYVATTTDKYMTACFVAFIASLWRLILYLRPPLNANT